MNSVLNIYNAAKAQNIGSVSQIVVGPKTGELKDKEVVVLKTDPQAVCNVRNQLITALKGELGEGKVSEISKRLLGEGGASPLSQKPLSSRQIEGAIVFAWTSKVDAVLSGTLKVANFPNDAKKLLRRVLKECAGHPDVAAFLDGSAQTPRDKLVALRRVCTLASQLGKPGEMMGAAYLSGFSANTELTMKYDGAVHATDAILRDTVAATVKEVLDTGLISIGDTVVEALLNDNSNKDVNQPNADVNQLRAFAKKTVDALHAGKKSSWPGDIKSAQGYLKTLGQEALKEARGKWKGGTNATVTNPAIKQNPPKNSPGTEVKSFAYGNDDKELDQKYGKLNSKLANIWKTIEEFDIAWRQTKDKGEAATKAKNDKRNELLAQAQLLRSELFNAINIDKVKLAPNDPRVTGLRAEFVKFLEQRERSDGKYYAPEYKCALLETFVKMPPSVLNLFVNNKVDSHQVEVLELVIASTAWKGKTLIELPTNKLDSGVGGLQIDKFFAINPRLVQEGDKATGNKWENANKVIKDDTDPNGGSFKITHLLDNPGEGNCFFYSVMNGLNDTQKLKIAPTQQNVEKFRQDYVKHLNLLQEKASSKTGKDAPVGFKILDETWVVAKGKGFADAKAVEEELKGKVKDVDGDISRDGYYADNAHGAFMADMLKRPVVILSDSQIGKGIKIFDRDLTEGRPLSGAPIILYYTRWGTGLFGHYQTARVDGPTMNYIKQQLENNTK